MLTKLKKNYKCFLLFLTKKTINNANNNLEMIFITGITIHTIKQ